MDTWLRVLIGAGVGLVGIVIYLAARLHMETAKKLGWGDVAALVAIGVVGVLLAGVADWILGPVTAAAWLRWVVIGVAFAACAGCCVAIVRGRIESNARLIATYFGGLFLGLLAIQLLIAEIT
jgi:hypothetical protein